MRGVVSPKVLVGIESHHQASCSRGGSVAAASTAKRGRKTEATTKVCVFAHAVATAAKRHENIDFIISDL
jgi:hypothetical protein